MKASVEISDVQRRHGLGGGASTPWRSATAQGTRRREAGGAKVGRVVDERELRSGDGGDVWAGSNGPCTGRFV